MGENKITSITRRGIADALTINRISYSGRFAESDFLNRLYPLHTMPSTDFRANFNTAYDNAYKDIYQHADRNPGDWQPDWVFTDSRFDLMHCDDENYLRFLLETINPSVRANDDETEKLVGIYNEYLARDGFHFYKESEISGRPVFKWSSDHTGHAQLAAKAADIKQYIDTEYVNKKIDLMKNAMTTNDTDLAIGTGKELLETFCKSILQSRSIAIDKNWTLPQLLKNTTNALDFKPKGADSPQEAERSIKQILGGIASIVQGVTELRNSYGSGHGKDADFKGLESKYAKLFVGVVAEIAIIYLATNGETKIAS